MNDEIKQEPAAALEAPGTTDGTTDALEIIGDALGLRKGFFNDLLLIDDDWTAVIKSHALLESVVVTRICSHLGKPELEGVLAEEVQMESRIAMLEALDLADKDERRMMRALGHLRNILVHNVKQTDFRFAAHLQDKGRRDQFVKDYGYWITGTIDAGGKAIPRADWVLAAPRLMIWMNVVKYAAQTASEKIQAEIDTRENEALGGLRRRLLIEALEQKD